MVSSKKANTKTPTKIPTKIPTEHEEQKELIKWVRDNKGIYYKLDMIYAVPNGAYLKGRGRAAAKLIREGMHPGVCDLCLPVPRGPFHGLYIEMKRLKGGKLSEEQALYINDLMELGYLAVMCKGWLAAREVIKAYYTLGEFYYEGNS